MRWNDSLRTYSAEFLRNICWRKPEQRVSANLAMDGSKCLKLWRNPLHIHHHAISPTHVWDTIVFSVKKTLVCQLPAGLLCVYLSRVVWLLACRAEPGRAAEMVPPAAAASVPYHGDPQKCPCDLEAGLCKIFWKSRLQDPAYWQGSLGLKNQSFKCLELKKENSWS